MINRRHTKERDEECGRLQRTWRLRTTQLSLVCLLAVLGSSAITGALAYNNNVAAGKSSSSTDEDLQVILLWFLCASHFLIYSWAVVQFFTFYWEFLVPTCPGRGGRERGDHASSHPF